MIKPLAAFALTLLLCSCSADAPVSDEEKYAAVTHYADLAHVIYQDAEVAAEALEHRLEDLLNQPDETHLRLARTAWLEARRPYLQTEVIRLGNPEFGTYHQRINGWPTSAEEVEATLQRNTDFSVANLPQLSSASGEKNTVLTGYHVIEALLWGEKDRPATDLMANHYCTTNGKPSPIDTCERRRKYLISTSKLLIEDLKQLEKSWSAEEKRNYRSEFLKLKLADAYSRILSGMTSTLLGHVAGKQLKEPFNTKSLAQTEDSGSQTYNNTINWTIAGVRNIYYGQYTAQDGTQYTGISIKTLLGKQNSKLQERITRASKQTDNSLHAIDNALEKQNRTFAELLSAETTDRTPNLQANQLIRDAIDALVMQTRLLEQAGTDFDVSVVQTDNAGFTF